MASRNYHVQFATTTDDKHLVSSTQAGVEFLPAGEAPEAELALDIVKLFIGEAKYARVMYDALLPKLIDSPPDLIVFDPLSIVGEGLAETLGVPSVHVSGHLLNVAYLGSEYSPSYPMVITGIASSKMGFLDRLKNTFNIMIARFLLPVVRGYVQNDFRNYAGLPSKWSEFSTAYGHSKLAIVANQFGMEPPRPISSNVHMVGPLLPRSHRALDEQIQTWLDSSTVPVVYISIGTNSIWTKQSANAVLDAIIEGTERGDYRVLWSIKSTQQELFYAEQLTRAKNTENIKILAFVEQLAVLESSQTAIFVTHSGLSSINEALFYGIPMVAMPMMLESDQPTNAARVEELHLGVWIDLRKVELTKEIFASKLDEVLSNPDYAKEAQRFQSIYRKLNGRQRAADLLELTLDPINLPQLLTPLDDSFCDNLDIYLVLFVGIFILFKLFKWSFSCCCKKKAKETPTPNKKNKTA